MCVSVDRSHDNCSYHNQKYSCKLNGIQRHFLFYMNLQVVLGLLEETTTQHLHGIFARAKNTSTVLSEICFIFHQRMCMAHCRRCGRRCRKTATLKLFSSLVDDGVLLEAWHSNREGRIKGKIYESFHSSGE